MKKIEKDFVLTLLQKGTSFDIEFQINSPFSILRFI